MQWKKRFSGFFTITCTSFTIIVLLYTVLSGFMDVPVNAKEIFVLFSVCAMVALVIFLTDFIPIKSISLRFAINFLDVFLTVFLFGGGLLGMFPFTWKIMLIVFGMLTVAYIGVVAVMFINEQITAADINKKILEMKNKNQKLQ